MNCILLSGGSGKRLWPLSNDIRSKQFLKVFKTASGEYESMVQRMYKMICSIDPNASVTVATSLSQVPLIRTQLGNDVDISVETCRRDTFPAIVLAAMYLKDVKHVGPEEPVVVCPVDPYVDADYFECLKTMSDEASKPGAPNLTLMGIKPTYPSAKYGYIFPNGTFKEKPSEETAAEYIKQGAVWNGGVFAFKLGYLVEKAHSILNFTDYKDLFDNYEKQTKISFDYAVAEKESSIKIVPFSGKWMDLGTWNTLTDTIDTNVMGSVILDTNCENTHVINELDIPIIASGLKNIVVVASEEGILVTEKNASSKMKELVEKISGGNYD